jgi:hypothetical protein
MHLVISRHLFKILRMILKPQKILMRQLNLKTPFQHLEFSKSETCTGLPKQVNLSSRMIMNVIKVANDVIESTAAFNLTQAGPDVKETETANELKKK